MNLFFAGLPSKLKLKFAKAAVARCEDYLSKLEIKIADQSDTTVSTFSHFLE